MTNIKLQYNHTFYVIVYLESVQLTSNQWKYGKIFKNYLTEYNGIKSKSKTGTKNRYSFINILTSLYNILETVSIKNKKIKFILINQVYKNQQNHNQKNLLLEKYREKFTHRYQEYKQHSFNNKTINENRHREKTCRTSIYHLYVVYKIIHTKNKFMAWKQLKNKSLIH